MKRLLVALLLAAVALFPISSASAQSASCTTYFANGPMPMTDCSTPAGSIDCTTFFANGPMPMTNCSGSGLAPQPAPAPVYVPPAAPPQPAVPAAPAPPVDPGLYYRDGNGMVQYIPIGTFVKEPTAPAIYVAAYGQLHAFSTWDQFLRWGGRADFSNVLVYSHIDQSAVGVPVPN